MTSLASLASVVMPCAGPLLSTVDKSQVRSHLSSPTACKSGLHTLRMEGSEFMSGPMHNDEFCVCDGDP